MTNPATSFWDVTGGTFKQLSSTYPWVAMIIVASIVAI